MGNRGSVLVEFSLILVLVVLGVAINLEVSRRVKFEVLLRHSAFLAVRAKMLGKGVPRAQVHTSGLPGFGPRVKPRAAEWRYHARYPSFLTVKYGKRVKHHFEVTRSCWFPY